MDRNGTVLFTHSSSPHSSLSGMTAYVRISGTMLVGQPGNAWGRRMHLQRLRLRVSVLPFRSLLIIELNSISRASFRRSSSGLAKKLYFRPLFPMKQSFLGRCSEGMISISSCIPAKLRSTEMHHAVHLVTYPVL